MEKIYHFNKRQAQQLVEFAFVVPILLIFMFIVVEFGAAINARMTASEAVKMSMVEVNKLSYIDGTTAEKEAFVENFMKSKIVQYLLNHNIPNSGSVNVKARYIPADGTAIIAVSFEYVPFFLVSGMLGNTVTTIPFSSSQVLNPHLFRPNVLPAAADAAHRTTQELSEYFTDGGGVFIDSGALIDTTTFDYDDGAFNIREQIAFLLRLYESKGDYPYLEYGVAHARLVDWEGNDLLPSNLRINLRTGTLEARSPYYPRPVPPALTPWFDTKIPYVWVASALGFNHLIYVKFNTGEMYIPEGTTGLWKILFGSANLTYSKGMELCGPVFACDADLRDTATVNERALRMNPRFGEGPPALWDNTYIMGTMEPIFIDTGANPGLADFLHVKGFYFSYTDDYAHWDAVNWNQQYFISTASPHVVTIDAATGTIYHADQANSAANPFYQPYLYRFKLWEHGTANAGVYDSTQDPAPAAEDNDMDDSTDGNNYYQVDIVDVYIDSDGDGIPDAWDRDPEYFDVNLDGSLDGTDPNIDMWAQKRCRGGINFGPGGTDPTGLCGEFIDDLTIGTVVLGETLAAGHMVFLSSGAGCKFHISTPYDIGGAVQLNHTARYLPEFNAGEFRSCDLDNDKDTEPNPIYYETGAAPPYTRKFTTWTSEAPADRRAAKVDGGFIHGTENVNDIELDPSIELNYLNTSDIFSTNSYVTRTPPVVW